MSQARRLAENPSALFRREVAQGPLSGLAVFSACAGESGAAADNLEYLAFGAVRARAWKSRRAEERALRYVRTPAGADTRLLVSAISRGDVPYQLHAAESILSCVMPFYHRIYSPGELEFITTSTYRRTPLFLSHRFRRCFAQRLDEVRQELHFLPIGWVLMPEHFHILIKPEPADTTALVMKGLKEESAKRILRTLRENLQYPWRRNTLARLRLPLTVHDESHCHLWQRRFYPFNVFLR